MGIAGERRLKRCHKICRLLLSTKRTAAMQEICIPCRDKRHQPNATTGSGPRPAHNQMRKRERRKPTRFSCGYSVADYDMGKAATRQYGTWMSPVLGGGGVAEPAYPRLDDTWGPPFRTFQAPTQSISPQSRS